MDEIETVLLEEIVDDTTGNIESTVIGSIESQPVDVHNNFLGGIMKGISSWSSELSKKLISKNDL